MERKKKHGRKKATVECWIEIVVANRLFLYFPYTSVGKEGKTLRVETKRREGIKNGNK